MQGNSGKERNKIVAIRPSSVKEGAMLRRKEVGEKGWKTGHKNLDEIISYKKGYSTTIYSYAHQGKTQFTLEQCVNLAIMYKTKVAVYLTEAGDYEEIVLEIAQTYMRRSLADVTLTDLELEFAIDTFVNEYFYIIPASSKFFSIEELAYAIQDTNKEYGIQLEVVVIDHFGNLDKSDNQKYFKTDENVKFVMQTINRMSRKLNLHTFILFHIRDTDPVKCSVTGKWYLPKPEHHNISGGQQANYQGMQMIAVWRPIYHPNKLGIVDPDTTNPFEINETRIIVSKSKPKHIGQLGERSLFFYGNNQAYKSRDEFGNETFALECYEPDGDLFGAELQYPSFAKLFKQRDLKHKEELFSGKIVLETNKDGVPVNFKDVGF